MRASPVVDEDEGERVKCVYKCKFCGAKIGVVLVNGELAAGGATVSRGVIRCRQCGRVVTHWRAPDAVDKLARWIDRRYG